MQHRIHSIYDRVVENSRLYPQRIGFVDQGSTMTFSQFHNQVNHLAAGMQAAGMEKGDRVALLMENRLEFALAYGAAAQLGFVLVLLNSRTSLEEMKQLMDLTHPRLMLSSQTFASQAQELHQHGNLDQTFVVDRQGGFGEDFSWLMQQGEVNHGVEPALEEPYLIIPTAAVDGQAKGATLSQNNVITAISWQVMEYGRENMATNLCFLPLFHILGAGTLLTTFFVGGCNLMMRRFEAKAAVALVEQYKATYFGSFPPLLQSILDAVENPQQLASLKMVFGIEAPPTIERLHQETKAEFWVGFGQAETSGLITTGRAKEYPGSAGVPNLMGQVALLGQEGELLPLGQEGEIVVTGPHVFLGYWGMKEATAFAFRGGWHHTGDKGMLDEQGVLWYRGRMPEKELIKTGGENVYPAEVEKVLLQHAKIKAAVVFGVPDAQWGEAVRAVVETLPGESLSEAEVQDFVASHIASFKKPRKVIFTKDLPEKNGQLDRDQVKRNYAD